MESLPRERTRAIGRCVPRILGCVPIGIAVAILLAGHVAQPAAAELPKVELVVTGPKQANVGDQVEFEFVITNRGTSATPTLLITDRFERGLAHAVSDKQVERDLAPIPPGQSQTVRITLHVTQPGPARHVVQIHLGDTVLASAVASLEAAEKPVAKPPAKPAPQPPSMPQPQVRPQPEPEAKPSPAPQPEPSPAPPPKAEAKPPTVAEVKTPAQAKPAAPGEAKPAGAPSAPAPAEPAKEPLPPYEESPDLGPPLVDNIQELKQLHPQFPVWLDRKNNRVVMVGAVCQRQAPLELLACPLGSKEHESILVLPVKPSLVHIGLLALGAEPGHPVQFQPKFIPPSGPEVEVTLVWKDDKGVRRSARAQEWVRNTKTGKAMDFPFVFAGSDWIDNPYTRRKEYRADVEGYLICVSNFPGALLDVAAASSADDSELLFDCFTERIPRKGTPVTIILSPKLPPASPAGQPPRSEGPPTGSGQKSSEGAKPAGASAGKPAEGRSPTGQGQPSSEGSGKPPTSSAPSGDTK